MTKVLQKRTRTRRTPTQIQADLEARKANQLVLEEAAQAREQERLEKIEAEEKTLKAKLLKL